METYKRILVPTDGSKLSLKAAREAAQLARRLKASITAVYVMPPWSPPVMLDISGVPAEVFDEGAFRKSTEATARAALGKVESIARAASVKCEAIALREQEPWKGIVKAARKCDLIAIASRGHTGVEAALFGSETRKVLANTRKPVLVCN